VNGPRRVPRARVASAVLAVLLVTVAAIGYRVSDPDSENELIRAPLDQTVGFGSGTVRVSDVRVGTTVQSGDHVWQTRGVFVVVNVALAARGRDSLLISDTRVLSRSGVTYRTGIGAQVIKADPGFEVSQNYVFEVDPQRMDDLVLEVWDKGVTFRYYQRTQTPLGITRANMAQWAQAGAGRRVVVARDQATTVLP
jgi:hypothetical protein